MILNERATQYRKHWESKGKKSPTEDEWYENAKAEDTNAWVSEDYWIEVAKDEISVPLEVPGKCPVSHTSMSLS